MRWAWFILAVNVLALALAAGLYAAGPERESYCGPGFTKHPQQPTCVNWRTKQYSDLRTRRTNAWERISEAVSG